MEKLTPWVFKHGEFAEEMCTRYWPKHESEFKDFFGRFFCYRANLNDPNPVQIPGFLKIDEKATLPRKKWETPGREPGFLQSQGMMLRALMETIYYNLEDLAEKCPELQ